MKSSKNQIKKNLLMLTIVTIVVVLFSSCGQNCTHCGEYATETISITGQIKGVIIDGPWNVSITQDNTENSAILTYCVCKNVKISAQQLSNGYVSIKLSNRSSNIHHDDFQATIRASSLEKIEGSGATIIHTYGHFNSFNEIVLSGASIASGLSSEGQSAKIKLSGASSLKEFKFEGQRLDANLSGASTLRINHLDIEKFTVDCSGASSLTCSGYATTTSFNGSGASLLKALDLESETLDIDFSGASSAEVTVNNTIKGKLSGASILQYRRALDVSGVHLSGGSKIIRLD